MKIFLDNQQRKILLSALVYYLRSAYTEEEIREQSLTKGDEEYTLEQRQEILDTLKQLIYMFKS